MIDYNASEGDPLNGKRAVLARADGSIVILSPAAAIPPGMSEEEYIQWFVLHMRYQARVAGESWPNETTHVGVVHESEIPKDFKGLQLLDDRGNKVGEIQSAHRWDGAKVIVDEAVAVSHTVARLKHQHKLNEVEAAAVESDLRKLGLKELAVATLTKADA